MRPTSSRNGLIAISVGTGSIGIAAAVLIHRICRAKGGSDRRFSSEAGKEFQIVAESLRSSWNLFCEKICNTDCLRNSVEKNSTNSRSPSVRENLVAIQVVLKFWFGQHGGPDQSQKKLWMVSKQNVILRQHVDKEIEHRFGNLLMELSTDNGWKEWCKDSELYGYRGKLAAIIVLDQFSRHIHRCILEGANTNSVLEIPEQACLDQMAYSVAQLFHEDHADEIHVGMISVPMVIFSLMPFRHAATVSNVESTQRKTTELAAVEHQCEGMIKAFRKATNRRLAVLQDEARRTGGSDATKECIVESVQASDNDILECCAFDADMDDVGKNIVYRTIRDFLVTQRFCFGSSPSPPRPIVISLSGGVDSMVIAAVLSHLQQTCAFNIHVVAVHIDYANRPESKAEADFVEQYCRTLCIDFRCRRIDEVTRGITARAEYERVAREIRYTFYRDTVKQCLEIADVNLDNSELGVVLGHHRGDLRENVLSNAHKGCGPLDLSGMTATSRNDGVTLYRPLLPLEKDTIFSYAHTFGVPYFKDTTPQWSTRGKLRNKLIPLLEEIYGDGSMNNLSNLATESDDCRKLLYYVIVKPFMEKVIQAPMGISFETSPWTSEGIFFWKFVLREALHSAGMGMFSDKSVISFVNRACSKKVREGWLQCRKDYSVYLRHDGKVFVLFPSSFPWNDTDQYICVGQEVEYGVDNAVKIGPWTVQAEIVDKHDVDIGKLMNAVAIPSMEFFMKGAFEYYLKVPTWQHNSGEFQPRTLVFKKFDKRSRPTSWKRVDTKIQNTLPLLGIDKRAIVALEDSVVGGTTHEDKNGEQQQNPVFTVRVSLRVQNSID